MNKQSSALIKSLNYLMPGVNPTELVSLQTSGKALINFTEL